MASITERPLYICVNKIDLIVNIYRHQKANYSPGNWHNIINSCKLYVGQPYFLHLQLQPKVSIHISIEFIRGGMWKVEVLSMHVSGLLSRITLTSHHVLWVYHVLSRRNPDTVCHEYMESTIPFTDKTAAFYG